LIFFFKKKKLGYLSNGASYMFDPPPTHTQWERALHRLTYPSG